MVSIATPLLWATFASIILLMLAIDLFVTGGGHKHRVSFREASIWSLIWVSLSLCFAAGLWWHLESSFGRELANTKTLEFLTGYLIEKALAVDNIFVWLMLFAYFGIPPELQKRILLYGVFGAIVMRTGMILAGAWLIEHVHWVLYVFGAFLLLTGIRMYWSADETPSLEDNRLIQWLKRRFDITPELDGERFFTLKNGARHATPLLLALVLVELSDVIFAVDSIPAIFAITTDPFIVLTSNIFAILGLRAMYFLLVGMADRFSLLKYGLAVVLMFIGLKMLLIDLYKIPIGFSLAVIALILGTSILASWRKHSAGD